MDSLRKRKGKVVFDIQGDMLGRPDILKAVFSEFYPVYITEVPFRNVREYHGYSLQFDEVEEGMAPIEYLCTVDMNNGGNPITTFARRDQVFTTTIDLPDKYEIKDGEIVLKQDA